MKKLALFTDEAMLMHSNGPGHSESPERLQKVVSRLKMADLPLTMWEPCREAKREELVRVHTSTHVDWLLSQRGLSGRIDEDTRYASGSVHAALLAAGASIDAVNAVLDKHATSAWALVRPPGHHAEPNKAMGFCLLNNVALAAKHAIEVRGLERVMIIDWDVHHGNGTQAAFDDDPRVLFFSTHQAPFYPHTGGARERGSGAGEGYTVNLPLPAGTTGADLLLLYRAFIPSLMAAFQPQLVLISAGFDAHKDDPLASFELTSRDFAGLMRIVKEAAEVVCDGRIVCVLEGGYDVSALSTSVLACARELVGETTTSTDGRGPIGEKVLAVARRLHIDRWPILEDA